MRTQFDSYRTVVVKVGSNLLTSDDGSLNVKRLNSLALDVGNLLKKGKQVVMISSGAVAAGVRKIGIKGRPNTVPEFQAAAAAGQIALMNHYYQVFQKIGIEVAQILLTRDDFNDRQRYLNIRNCIMNLIGKGIVPIVNENDSVAVEELKFGDNDMLAGYVAMGLKADVLVVLTSVEGLYRKKGKRKEIIPEVSEINEEIENMVYEEKTVMGTGGMRSKIATAKMVTSAGEPVVLADGRVDTILKRIFMGEEVGTLFLPTRKKISGWKRWLAFPAKSKGTVVVDQGAAAAVMHKGKSLLPAGVTAVEGAFETGSLISILTQERDIIAKGLTNYTSQEIEKIKGKHSGEIKNVLGYSAYNEIVHRNNMVLTEH